jgi:hypothetical protein
MWQQATTQDHDLNIIKTILETEGELLKATLEKKAYYKEWSEGKLNVEDGILYQLEEPKASRIRQLQRRVVPKSLIPTILAAYHATPLAGHTGLYKTYWRIAARYWWPGMSKDIREAVLNCGHCRLANATSHHAQQILKALSTDEPFDIISMDLWHPGKTARNPDTKYQKAILTSLCNMTGFASMAFVQEITSDLIARLAFSHCFVPNGLPKLIIIDDGSEFKGVLRQACETLGIQYYVACPEAHNAVLAERFHRYLNKVAKIGVIDHQTYEQWRMDALFACYAWNASPIDGTDIIRSFAAKSRTFRFPLDIQTDHEVARIPQEGEAAISHIETTFPLWFRQKELLRLLNDERRQRHRERADKHKKRRVFQPGDIVIVRKQVNSNAAEGRPAKLTLRARGPYRILEAAGDNAYWIQKLPALQNISTRIGYRHKELAMRMEKLPSTIVIHKRVDTLDSRLAQMDGELANNPLEKNLGFFDFGKYTLAPDDAAFAFVKVNEMWNEPIQAVMDSEEEASSDEETEGQDNEAIPEPNEDANEPTTDATTESTETVPTTNAEDATTRPKRKRSTTTTNRTQRTRQSQKKRTRENTDETNTPDKRIQQNTIRTTKKYLSVLWKDINRSRDKLFFIQRHDTSRPRPEWHLVQIDLDETNPRLAKATGEYHVKYFIRNYTQSKKRTTRNCKYWPLIRELRPDGNFGAILMIRPEKVDELLAKKPFSRGWYQREENLATNGLIGPMDFTQIDQESHRIKAAHWNALLEITAEHNIEAKDINSIVPL